MKLNKHKCPSSTRFVSVIIKDYKHPREKYKFLKKMGDGSASKIYISYSPKDNKQSVTKKIHKSEEWKNELAILKKVSEYDTDKLLKILDFYETDRYVYLITKFYKGYDLFDHIDINVPIPESQSIPIIKEMAKCIQQSHNIDIAHLDIKCENFMVKSMSPPNFVLIDFGHAENIKENEITKGYSKYGTKYYLCPEGYDCYYSTKSDIWSLGICAHLILTGEYPYNKNSKTPNRDLKQGKIKLNKKLSQNCRNFLQRCLEVDPQNRYDIDQLMCSNYLNLIV